MADTVRAFDFEIDIHGAWVIVKREPLCPGCLSEQEIDAQIQLLKDNLDRVAREMKDAVREQESKPLFDMES